MNPQAADIVKVDSEALYAIARQMVEQSSGNLRARALLPQSFELLCARSHFSSFRQIQMFLLNTGGTPAACLLLTTIPVIANLSHLCSRLEIHTVPGKRLHRETVRSIVRASLAIANRDTLALMIAKPDSSLNYQPDAGKYYDAFTWLGHKVSGFGSTAYSFASCYARIMAKQSTR